MDDICLYRQGVDARLQTGNRDAGRKRYLPYLHAAPAEHKHPNQADQRSAKKKPKTDSSIRKVWRPDKSGHRKRLPISSANGKRHRTRYGTFSVTKNLVISGSRHAQRPTSGKTKEPGALNDALDKPVHPQTKNTVNKSPRHFFWRSRADSNGRPTA